MVCVCVWGSKSGGLCLALCACRSKPVVVTCFIEAYMCQPLLPSCVVVCVDYTLTPPSPPDTCLPSGRSQTLYDEMSLRAGARSLSLSFSFCLSFVCVSCLLCFLYIQYIYLYLYMYNVYTHTRRGMCSITDLSQGDLVIGECTHTSVGGPMCTYIHTH